jgi:hypothetical protein
MASPQGAGHRLDRHMLTIPKITSSFGASQDCRDLPEIAASFDASAAPPQSHREPKDRREVKGEFDVGGRRTNVTPGFS